MDKLTLTLNLPPEVIAWLKAEGGPQHRTAQGEAAIRCEESLKASYQRTLKTAKNGTPADMVRP